jgi:lysophospholipase L1-like esterase
MIGRLAATIWTVAIALAGPASAQPAILSRPVKVGVLADPCATLDPAPDVVKAFMAQMATAKAAHRPTPTPPPEALKIYADWQQKLLVSDFGGLCHYRAANATLPQPTDHRTIFFGDSITELWGMAAPELFRNDVLDRGVSGQTTEQMLIRFRADVIDLHPRLVHIIAGTNDIAGNTGPTTLAWIEANIETMVDIAEAHHITVILGATPPASHFGWRPGIAPADTIAIYDRWLQEFADRHHIRFVDYYAVLTDGQGGMKPSLSADGVHPNDSGFKRMTPVALRAVDDALRVPQIR